MTPLRLCLLALCTLLVGIQTGAAPPPDQIFPVAVWYSGGKARAPMLEPLTADSADRWRQDLRSIKALGFNSVRTWVEWSAGEPREGEFHLENLDLLLRLAEEEGLRVIVQYYIDSAPDWVGKRFPDGHYRAQDGQPIKSQAAPGFCFDHPGVRAAALRFVKVVARRSSKSPAFYAYDLWSEPAILNWAEISYLPRGTFCYCPSSQARFRGWLQTKYGSIKKLNAAWYRTFAQWADVEPPRYGTILTYADYMDWKTYIGDKLAQDLRSRADAVRAIDKLHPTTSHAPNPSPLVRTLADIDASDDYLMKHSVDFFGTSFYPKLTSPDRNWTLQRRVLAMDLVRSVTGDRGFYVGELQAGYGVHGVIAGSEVTSNDLELQAWGMVARGARSISFYAYYPMSTGYESGGYGLIALDGKVTPRAQRAGDVAKQIAGDADLLLIAKPMPSPVAIIFNPLVPLMGGEQNYGNRLAIHQSVAGYHRMLFERNINVDVISSRELSPQQLSHYKLVLLPYPLMMEPAMSDTLKQYVTDGGHLLLEARAGWIDSAGRAQSALPGFGWHEVIGVREQTLEPGAEFTLLYGESRFTGITFRERFEVLSPDAKVLLQYADGLPAAYERIVGKGSVAVVGTFIGQANQLKPLEMHPFGDLLVKWAGLSRPEVQSSSFVELKESRSGNVKIAYLFNHGTQATNVTYRPAISSGNTWTVRELSRNDGEAAKLQDGRVQLQLPPESVRVLVFSPPQQ